MTFPTFPFDLVSSIVRGGYTQNDDEDAHNNTRETPKSEYTLQAVANHIGGSIDGGHYNSYCRTKE